jgi:hypothetical protein
MGFLYFNALFNLNLKPCLPADMSGEAIAKTEALTAKGGTVNLFLIMDVPLFHANV